MVDSYPTYPLQRVSHPVQTVLSAISGAYFSAALVTDIAYVRSANMMWANFSSWMIVAGLVTGGFAILVALINAVRQPAFESRRPAWLMLLGLIIVWVLSLLNAFVHSRDAWTSVMPTGLALSAAVFVILLILAWAGWSISRTRAGAL